MKLVPTALPGAFVIEPERFTDERGHFVRTFDAEVFRAHGLDDRVVQCSASWNAQAGTLRGIHFQASPHEEAKLIRVSRGAIFDVLVDLASRRWIGVELSAQNGRSLYAPAGLAHGFQALLDDTEVLYQISVPYVSEAARGVRWDDAALGIDWPPAPRGRTISQRDRDYPDLGW